MKLTRLALLTSLSLIFSGICFCLAQQSGPNQEDLDYIFEHDVAPMQKSEVDSLITWQERLLIQTDKQFISENAPLFFKAYTLTGPNRVPATLSKVLKVELLNKEKEIVLSQYFKINQGESEGALVLPKKMKKGVYTLRAYTRWMQNYGEAFYGTKQLELISGEAKENTSEKKTELISVSFHPEGGNLIANVPNRVLIKATSSHFKKGKTSGKIYDKNNRVVASVMAYGASILSTILTPKPGEAYFLKLSGGQSFELPKISSEGYVLQINNLKKSTLGIRVESTGESSQKKVWLKGEMGGVTYFNEELELAALNDVNIAKQGIPFGILTISLIDEVGNELAKRPVAIQIKNSLKLAIVQEEVETDSNELVFKVKVKDENGQPVTTKVSLSAVNFGDNGYSTGFNAGYSFDWDSDSDVSKQDVTNLNRQERFLGDLELLTSVNKNNDIVSQTVPNHIKYPFQQGLNLFGYAYNLNNQLLANTEIQMLGASNTDLVVKEFTTDSFGKVRLENLQFVGETELVFRTKGEDAASRLVKIVPVQEGSEGESDSESKLDFGAQKKGKIVSTSPWQPDTDEDIIELDEVEVADKKLLKIRGAMPSVYGVEPTRVTYQDEDRPRTIPELFLAIPGVRVIGLGSIDPQLILPIAAGSGPVLWVLDGLALPQQSLNDIMSLVMDTDVERIEILYAAKAAIYGARASGGVVAIYTRGGAGMDYVNRKEGRLNFQGYFEAPNFKEYISEVYKKPKKYQDATTTLFWDPNILTDKNGEAVIRIKKPFSLNRLVLKAITIDSSGEIGSTQLIHED